jgi:hypothetical protein
MSYPQQPGRPPAPVPGRQYAPPPQQTLRQYGAPIPPQAGGYRPQTGGVAPQRTGIAPQRGGLAPSTVAPISSTYTHGQTLGQFWRSDIRSTRVDGRRARWPGTIAFFAGLAAVILLVAGLVGVSIVILSIAAAFSVVAGFFALVALIAGFGRLLGFFGLLFALAGNIYVVGPLFGLG